MHCEHRRHSPDTLRDHGVRQHEGGSRHEEERAGQAERQVLRRRELCHDRALPALRGDDGHLQRHHFHEHRTRGRHRGEVATGDGRVLRYVQAGLCVSSLFELMKFCSALRNLYLFQFGLENTQPYAQAHKCNLLLRQLLRPACRGTQV